MRKCTILDKDDIIQTIANSFNVDVKKVEIVVDNIANSQSEIKVIVEEPVNPMR